MTGVVNVSAPAYSELTVLIAARVTAARALVSVPPAYGEPRVETQLRIMTTRPFDPRVSISV